jgi:hypothetical protein
VENPVEQKDIWDKLSSIAGLIASVLIPIVVVVIGNEYSATIRYSENSVQYTELAIKVLDNQPTEENRNLRLWAIDILNQYSGVNINEGAKKELLQLRLTKKIDEFVKEKYTPSVVKAVVDFLSDNGDWKKAINAQNHEAISMMLEVSIVEAMNEIEEYKNIISEPINNINEKTNRQRVFDIEKQINRLTKDNE